MKTCTHCGLTKQGNEFYKRSRAKCGLKSECKDCSKKRAVLYYLNNPSKIKASTKKWSDANRANKRASSKKWETANPEKWKACYQKSLAKKRSTPKGQLNNSMAANMWQSLRGAKAGRNWESLTGYTVDQLKKHLEKQFKDGMSWGNYGQWHIDHIIPITAFNYAKPEDIDFKRCWALGNLRPLDKKENLRKNNKLTQPFQASMII